MALPVFMSTKINSPADRASFLPCLMDAVAFLRMADEKRRGRIVSKTAAAHARRMRIGIAIAAEMWAAVVCADVRTEIALTLPALRLIVRK